MFTRSSAAEPKTLPLKTNANPAPNTPQQQRRSGLVETISQDQRRSGPAESGKLSVISNDLKIIGQGLKIISQGTLQVDGEVEGDVAGSEIIVGAHGQVTGMVAAERVIVRGKISGVIRGMVVALQSSARVEGEIHHVSLAIEQGAEFDGRCRRPADPSELKLDLDAFGRS